MCNKFEARKQSDDDLRVQNGNSWILRSGEGVAHQLDRVLAVTCFRDKPMGRGRGQMKKANELVTWDSARAIMRKLWPKMSQMQVAYYHREAKSGKHPSKGTFHEELMVRRTERYARSAGQAGRHNRDVICLPEHFEKGLRGPPHRQHHVSCRS